MRIGILGSGLMGSKLGTIFARAGNDVIFSYSRSRQKLNRLARNAGNNARAGTPAEAAQDADALLLAVHWTRVEDVLARAGNLSGKVVLTCSLPMSKDDSHMSDISIANGVSVAPYVPEVLMPKPGEPANYSRGKPYPTILGIGQILSG